jgi:glycosyltransferase involved in cell wall biosynthesis
MYQELAGVEPVEVDSPYAHLGITVGVITRNRAGDLAEMLESLTRQVRPPDEVLVVDNGSTDRTKEVLERFRECLPIQYKFLERADIPAARNMVIESAANEIISFIDDDCISEPQWLAAIERGFLRAENVGVVGGWVHHQPAARRSTVDNYYRIFHHIKS